jgi:uncharacterized protein (TIGR00730 family)
MIAFAASLRPVGRTANATIAHATPKAIAAGALMEKKILKAYEDVAFLKRNELRSVRLQLELLKPEITLLDHDVRSTVVVFGSARTLTPEQAAQRVKEAETALAAHPGNAKLKTQLDQAHLAVHNSTYYAMARAFAAQISQLGQAHGQHDYVVCTGGGPGIMEAANRGAADVDAKSIGLNITLPHEQRPNPYISPEFNFLFHYFSIRKMHFLLRAKALCAFPGGYGTLDELFETLTLIQTHKTRKIPVILFGQDYWDELIRWQTFLDWGMISPEDLDLFHYAKTPEEGVEKIVRFYETSPA